jgi:uncharacterized membrane protein
MNRETFLIQFKRSLSALPESEKRDILYDYEEHFRIGLEHGKSEEQIAASLGNPRVLGRSYRIDALLGREVEGPEAAGGAERAQGRAGRVLRALFASISLGLFNALFVVGPFAGAVGVLVALWATAAALALAGAAILVGLVVLPFLSISSGLGAAEVVFALLSGAGVGALGVLAGVGMLKLTRLFWVGIERYVRFNLRIIRK